MTMRRRLLVTLAILLMTALIGVGYASVTDMLYISGSAEIVAPSYDVYISDITPGASGGMEINQYFRTVMSAKTTSRGTASFTVTVENKSDKIYVFERVIDGAEVNIEGIYNGTDITYALDGLTELQEIHPGGTITFELTVSNPKGVLTDNYFLDFNFIEKTGTEILPGTDPVEVKYEVVFVYNNGDSDRTVIVDDGALLERPADPTRDGYEFTGWYKDVSLASAWSFDSDTVTTNTTLYAGWSQNGETPDPPVTQVQYEIVFKYNNGDPDRTVIVDDGALLEKPADPTREGYVFSGWYKDVSLASAWSFDSDTVDSNTTLYAGWRTEQSESDGYHEDFLGLVEALLSENNSCLNDNDLIFDAVMESLTSKKRPKEDAPILHCHVNSISGGTMTSIAEYANVKLTQDLHFVFEVDPDPAYQDSRLRLYMYYESDCESASAGEEILVYKQILTRGDDGVWFADGTYIGRATVGYYFGGGSSGKDRWTIDAYSWKAGAPEA